MATFDSREKGFEDKFAHEEAFKFKALMKRNALFASWAAGALGKEKTLAEAYVTELLKGAVESSDGEHVLHRVKNDFQAASLQFSEHQLRRIFDDYMATAMEELRKA
jgi:hypothetical protein